jgi:hypothetical protein
VAQYPPDARLPEQFAPEPPLMPSPDAEDADLVA